MNKNNLLWIAVGAAFCFLAVVMGAFGAHALKDLLGDRSKEIYQLAVRYQMWHGLAILLSSALAGWRFHWMLNWSRLFFTLGCLLFSGSLYALAFISLGSFALLTPLGGLFMLLGWLFIILYAFSQTKKLSV